MAQSLVFDNCFDSCSVAIGTKDKVLKEKNSTCSDGFMFLSKFIKDILGNNHIDKVITTVGPGSFTGIRIGIATALGIAAIRDIECFGISTFDITLFQAILKNQINDKYLEINSKECGIIVLLDSKRSGLCYYKKYTYKQLKDIYLSYKDDYNHIPDNTKYDISHGINNIDELISTHRGIIITNIKNLRGQQTKNIRKIPDDTSNKIDEIIFVEKIEAKNILKAPNVLLQNNIKPIYS